MRLFAYAPRRRHGGALVNVLFFIMITSVLLAGMGSFAISHQTRAKVDSDLRDWMLSRLYYAYGDFKDPKVYAKAWTVELPLNRDETYQMFEYSCQEGNYAMANSLSFGRKRDREAASGSGASR